MKTIFVPSIAILALLLAGGCRSHGTRVSDFLHDETVQHEILSTIVGNHELMLKLIDEIKKSDHASMMIRHLLSVTAPSTASSGHENCPMDSQPSGRSKDLKSSPYAGQETRTVKALSDNDIQQLMAGEGMGMARAAELNHYPGPRHVMALSSELRLTPEQTKATQKAYDEMHSAAAALGKSIVDKETALDKEFAGGTITPEHLVANVSEISRLQGDLRTTHLRAHLKMKSILSPGQQAAYDSLRGYGGGMTMGRDHQMN